MWLDDRGIAHTRPHPDCADLVHLSPGGYAAFVETPSAWLHEALDEVEADFFAHITEWTPDPAEEARFMDRLPPPITLGLTGPPEATAELLTVQLQRQPPRWRLDYVRALRDLLSFLHEPNQRLKREPVDRREHPRPRRIGGVASVERGALQPAGRAPRDPSAMTSSRGSKRRRPMLPRNIDLTVRGRSSQVSTAKLRSPLVAN